MKTPITARLSRKVAFFRKDEEGSIIVLTLFLIIAMIWTAGIAVDMMRFETYRARLQSTVDRAVLAAADLDSCLEAEDPADVVRDYVAKAGFQNQLGDIEVNRDESSCEISAEATINVNTIFMEAYYIDDEGYRIDQLGTTVLSGATESIDDVEISLVLDVSGSMRGTKLTQLQGAASEFVETIHDTVQEERLSFSIVPYSTQVNLGADLYAQYWTRYQHDNSFCLDLPVTTYSTTSIDPDIRYNQSAHFDADGGASYSTLRVAGNQGSGNPEVWACNIYPTSAILPFTNNLTEMQTHIDGFEADAWTSIEMGANWGVALLDPESQEVAAGLAAAGVIDPQYSDRPAPFDVTETLKVLVLMTDGENTRDYVMSTTHRHQWTDIWFAWDMQYEDDGTFIGDPTTYVTDTAALRANDALRGVNVVYADNNSAQQFFVRDREPSDFDGDGTSSEWHYWVEGVFVDHDNDANGSTPDGDDDDFSSLRRDDSPPVWTNQRFGARQTWQDIWSRFTVRSHAWNFRGDQTDDFGQYNDWYNDLITITTSAEKDRRLDLICTAAKDAGIEIFTIGFEVSDRAAQVMSDCATTTNNFYRVDGLEIGTAFNSIANQISALRLYQ